MKGPLTDDPCTPIAYKRLRVGAAFQFIRDGAVFVRCRGGFRPGRGGELNDCEPERLVIPYRSDLVRVVRDTGAVEWVPHEAVVLRELNCQFDAERNPRKLLGIIRQLDEGRGVLLEQGWTVEQLGANALNTTVERFRELVAQGTYHVNYGCPVSLGHRVWEPNWLACSLLESMPSVAAAMDRYYRPERLNRPGGTRERLIADRETEITEKGYAWLASHHDSVTGRVLYLRPLGAHVAVYSDPRAA